MINTDNVQSIKRKKDLENGRIEEDEGNIGTLCLDDLSGFVFTK